MPDDACAPDDDEALALEAALLEVSDTAPTEADGDQAAPDGGDA